LLDSHTVIASAAKVGKSSRQIASEILIGCFIVVFALLIAKSPAALGIFWISSNSLHLLECIILDSVKVRRLLGIPKHYLEPSNIYLFKYAVTLNGFKKILKRFKR
jgi:membrane protein insertase Oxa1/YidC/SpoIIIJ